MDVASVELEREIVTRVAEAVARFGVAGDVRIDGERVVLEGHGPVVSAPLGTLRADWTVLAPDVRDRRCAELARRLVGDRRASSSVAPSRRLGTPGWVAPAAIALAAVAAVYAAWHVLSPAPAVPAAPVVRAPLQSADTAEQAREQRAAHVCDEARARAVRGATLGPTDVEGWVVEIGLLRPGNTPELVYDPGLASFVDRPPGKLVGRFAWNGAPTLRALSGPGTEVEIADASAPGFRGVALTFKGRYAAPYFHADQRPEFVRVAATLAERLGATYAGLYAHCAGGTTHHVGTWFEGQGPGGATAALFYFMGLYADASQRLAALPDDHGAALARIGEATKDLKRQRVATLLGTYGGMIAGKDDGPGYITFPFRDSNRAARASFGIAQELALIPRQ